MSLQTQRAQSAGDLHSTHNVSSGRLVSSAPLFICGWLTRDFVQAYLKFAGIDFDIVPSNNHASPTGALPFLIPALPVGTDTPIPSNKLQKWAIEEVHCEEEQQLNIRFEVYSSLLDSRIRNAWVCLG